MRGIEIRSREKGFVLWGHCQNLLDDPRIRHVILDMAITHEENKSHKKIKIILFMVVSDCVMKILNYLQNCSVFALY